MLNFENHTHSQMRCDSRFILTDGTYDCEASAAIKSKVNLPFKIAKLIIFQSNCITHSFQWLLLASTYTAIEIIPVAMHDGQPLTHPRHQ